MSKRILSMLLALVMALSLCVPAFAADEFEAEAPAVQEEETPAAPVAEEPDMPAAAAAEPEAAGDEPVAAAAGNGTFKVEGDESQIYAISQYDYTEYKDLGDPREVGVFPKAEIYIWLKPGYDVEETEGGGFNWYWEEEIPANDEDVLPAYVSWLMVPEEGGDMTVTIVEGDPMPETVPVTYTGDRDARFGSTAKAYADGDLTNYVLFKPGYYPKIEGVTMYYVDSGVDDTYGPWRKAEYGVNEGVNSVTVDLVKSTGKFEIEAPEGVVYYADLLNGPAPETWWDTAIWVSDLTENNDIYPGMGINLVISADYELEGLDKALLVNTDIGTVNNKPARWYSIKTPDAGGLKLTVRKAEGKLITATVINESGADFQFTNPAAQLDDGTYWLLTTGNVGMIVEDGYWPGVDGATYCDTVVNEENGEITRFYTVDEGAESITVVVLPVDKTALEVNFVLAEVPDAPASGTGWVENEVTGDIYFYKDGEVKKGFWVGKVDGASKWDNTWYYVGGDGRMLTGMWYLDDLHGGAGWYFLQPTDDNGQIGKMLTGWQWLGGDYGTCYFSKKAGESGKCTYSTELGSWNGVTWVK